MNKTPLKKNIQLLTGLIFGIVFGFLLQKSGVTTYEVMINELLLTDLTVLKVMLSSVITTMLLISIILPSGYIKLQPKSGSLKSSIIGGLLFGIGMATLGYCPGTVAGAVGSGNIDGLIGGFIGITIGSGIFAAQYSQLKKLNIVTKDRFSEVSLFSRMKIHPLLYTIPFSAVLSIFLYYIETKGL